MERKCLEDCVTQQARDKYRSVNLQTNIEISDVRSDRFCTTLLHALMDCIQTLSGSHLCRQEEQFHTFSHRCMVRLKKTCSLMNYVTLALSKKTTYEHDAGSKVSKNRWDIGINRSVL